MSNISEFNISNIEKDINEIFSSQQKIKSLTSTLYAIKAEMAILEHLMSVIEKSSTNRSEVTNVL